ncbi:MAG: OmpA family protein [Bacteroidota bacterium]
MKLTAQRFTALLFMLLLAAGTLHAQFRRADRLLSSGEYLKAIDAYERGLRRHDNADAMERLANCYRIVHNYPKAEYWYARTIAAKPDVNPIVFLWYGSVLKMNGKPEDARKQFERFMTIKPDDERGKAEVKALSAMKVWMEDTRMYEVKTVPALNTEFSEFGVSFYSKGLLIVSDRGQRDLLNDENASASGNAYFAIYTLKYNRTGDSANFGIPSKLPRRICPDNHNGPASLTADNKLMAFNRVGRTVKLRSKKFVNRNKIFFSTNSLFGWSKPEPFLWNSDLYSCAHPALSADRQLLYFSSDMPGSLGGMDIWMCRRDGDSWGKPINLGASINTIADEVFPYLRGDGTLFFSSSGHPGLGGLDIFATKQANGIWLEPANQGAPLNSLTDDFSIVFDANNQTGYFASDRVGGKGKDDIYRFNVLANFTIIKGRMLLSRSLSDPLPDARVQLIDSTGKVVAETRTDATGGFVFRNIHADRTYLVRLDEEDPGIGTHKKYYMTDENDVPMRVSIFDETGGRYTFTDIPVKPGTPPQLLADDEYLTIAGNLITEGTSPQAIANTEVKLVDETGNVVQTTTTNAFGAFAFTRIPPDRSYLVVLDTVADVTLPPGSKIIVTNKSGKQISTLSPDAKGQYTLRILKNDRTTLAAMDVEDQELRLDLRGTITSDSTGKPVGNAMLSAVDEFGKVLQTVRTDERGNFKFVNLPGDKSYLVRIDDVEDQNMSSLGKLFVKDVNGNIIREIRVTAGKYQFRILPSDRTSLAKVYVDDPWLEVLQMKAKAKSDSLLIIENIYYEVDDWKILPEAERTLTKVIQVMKADPNIVIEISSHTDSRASADYNNKLSLKRAQTVLDYLVKAGIDKKRLKAVGYGEKRLLNVCADDVECTDEQHAKNRRTEFKINRR